ncbi:hypothetical protein ACGFYU_02200 [Streptomyces sp. NPDC048337]|uniref:hypothetical protein n=1 Tax=Streptomyces sp. NPDC048337 TaxID=3365535 RepID=UPI00371A5C10
MTDTARQSRHLPAKTMPRPTWSPAARSSASVTRAVKRISARAGIPIGWTGHSLRIGLSSVSRRKKNSDTIAIAAQTAPASFDDSAGGPFYDRGAIRGIFAGEWQLARLAGARIGPHAHGPAEEALVLRTRRTWRDRFGLAAVLAALGILAVVLPAAAVNGTVWTTLTAMPTPRFTLAATAIHCPPGMTGTCLCCTLF